MSMLPADTHRRLALRLHLVATSGRCGYCDGTGDVVSITGEWRGVCTECEAALAARLPVRPWEFDPGLDPERCTCAGADSFCEICIATRYLFEEWAKEQRLLDASAWIAYQRAWPEAMSGVPVRSFCGGNQPVFKYESPQALEWDEVLLPDLLAASEAAEPSGDAP